MPATDRPKRLLFLIQALAGGGAERVVVRLLTRFAADAEPGTYHLALIKPRIEYPVPAGVRLHLLGPERGSRFGDQLGQARAFLRLVRLVRRERPAAIVSLMPRGNLLNLLGRRLVPGWPRTVISERVAVAHNYRGRRRLLATLLFRLLYPFADSVIAVSGGVAKELRQRGVPADRITVIYNPIIADNLIAQADAGEAHPWVAAPEPVLVAMGRLVEQKDYPTLLRALAAVRETHPARLIVFGDGPDRPALEAEARRLGIDEAVAWAGFDANPFATLRGATLFVMPSLWEGFPNALLEAMALGLPVVASDCQWGPREMLKPDAGLLVPPGDVAALTGAVRRLLEDDRLRQEYGRRAIERAKAFDAEAISQQYLSVINDRHPTVQEGESRSASERRERPREAA